MIKVLIVDDQRMVREMIKLNLEKLENIKIVNSIENAQMAEMFCSNGQIDLIIMDICTANGESGLEASRNIKKYYPNIKIIIVTSMPEHSFIEKAKDIGCDSFWYKDFDKISFIEVVEKTLNGEKIYPDRTPTIEIGLAKSYEFTSRELEVLRELVNGSTYLEISENLDISINTVKFHIKNLLSKTGYTNSMQLVIDVVNKKLILPEF
ncbi:response regulator transcription factor [Parvimonas parva]|uniref:Response regulator transcription factor n=1 Tax=Parvimonas parva TaxID=2769485 RepID=A0ABS1C9Y2_9FIRM|nr:response regulator transcription factor [Parvimonas parva]MBK1468914.1 response regulator transcription factor [Parvimonas parva]